MFIEYSRLCTQSEYGVSTITKRSDTETHQHVIAAISYIVALGTVEKLFRRAPHGYSQAADARAWKREKAGHKLLGLRYNKTHVVKSCERTHIWAWT